MIKNTVKIFKESYISIGIGIVGGYLGTLIKLPLPWLLGALALNFLFTFTKAKITFSQKLLTSNIFNYWNYIRRFFRQIFAL